MSRLNQVLLLLLIGLCTVYPAAAEQTTIADIQAAGNLQIKSGLSEHSTVVPGQRVRLIIETATNRWFTGGTKITLPEVNGLVILQNEQFASNASEMRNGQTWVVQRWELEVFPQQAGDFYIPPISLRMEVNTAGADSIEGAALAPGVSLTVGLPKSLSNIEDWVAAPEFTIDQSFDRPLEGLVVGDAFEQTIEIQATDVMAMMLPGYTPAQQPGLTAYPSTAELVNNVNRGQTTAKRTLRVSYVVEQAGQFLLPARDYYWWNTASNTLELVSIPATALAVGATQSAGTGWARIALAMGAACAALLAMAYLVKLRISKFAGPHHNHYLAALQRQINRLQRFFAPALPEKLNPESSAAEQKAWR